MLLGARGAAFGDLTYILHTNWSSNGMKYLKNALKRQKNANEMRDKTKILHCKKIGSFRFKNKPSVI